MPDYLIILFEFFTSCSMLLHLPFSVSLQRTLRCVSSKTLGRGRALSPKLMSTGRWPLCFALRPTVTLTSLSQWESRCNSGGPLTEKSVSQWTSSTCRQIQVKYIICRKCAEYVQLFSNLTSLSFPPWQMNTGWVRRESGQEICSRTWS